MEYGNLAYSWDDEGHFSAEKNIQKKREELRAKKQQAKKKNAVTVVGVVFMLMVAAFFMISKNVSEYETELKIKSLEKELAELQSYTSQKKFELEKDIDLKIIEETATARLGMKRPDKNQIVYVNVKQTDNCELTSGEVEGMANKVASTASGVKKNIVGIFSLR